MNSIVRFVRRIANATSSSDSKRRVVKSEKTSFVQSDFVPNNQTVRSNGESGSKQENRVKLAIKKKTGQKKYKEAKETWVQQNANNDNNLHYAWPGQDSFKKNYIGKETIPKVECESKEKQSKNVYGKQSIIGQNNASKAFRNTDCKCSLQSLSTLKAKPSSLLLTTTDDSKKKDEKICIVQTNASKLNDPKKVFEYTKIEKVQYSKPSTIKPSTEDALKINLPAVGVERLETHKGTHKEKIGLKDDGEGEANLKSILCENSTPISTHDQCKQKSGPISHRTVPDKHYDPEVVSSIQIESFVEPRSFSQLAGKEKKNKKISILSTPIKNDLSKVVTERDSTPIALPKLVSPLSSQTKKTENTHTLFNRSKPRSNSLPARPIENNHRISFVRDEQLKSKEDAEKSMDKKAKLKGFLLCKLAHSSPIAIIEEVKKMEELYGKIANCYEGISASDILYCTLNTHALDKWRMIINSKNICGIIVVHIAGKAKHIRLKKSSPTVGLVLTDNGFDKTYIKDIRQDTLAAKATPKITAGDYIAAINAKNMNGKRHFEVAAFIKEIPVGDDIFLHLVEPMKDDFALEERVATHHLPDVNPSLEIQRCAKGSVLIQGPPQTLLNCIDEIIDYHLNYKIFNAAQMVWKIGNESRTIHDMKIDLKKTKLGKYDLPNEALFDMWCLIEDWKNDQLPHMQCEESSRRKSFKNHT